MNDRGVSAPARLLKFAGRIRRAMMTTIDWIFFAHRRLLGFGRIYVIHLRKRRLTDDFVVVSPEPPRIRYTLWKLGILSGLRLVSPEEARKLTRGRALAHFWHRDVTWDAEPFRPGLINGRCRDISKTRVDDVFSQVFGFATRIDPTVADGIAVKKPDENCVGTGIFVDCPIPLEEVEKGYVYQQLVDNVVREGVVREYRVSVMFGIITEVVVQERTIDRRLYGRGGGGTVSAETKQAEAVFSRDELDKIYRFCDQLGLDFGELDILPSPSEGRIYILDANTTPTILVRGNAFRTERIDALAARADLFHEMSLDHYRAGHADAGAAQSVMLSALGQTR